MNKNFRQGQILKIVRGTNIYTQEELAKELSRNGINATQVTLSRDMRELGLVKTGEGYRQLKAEQAGPRIADVVNECLLDVRIAQNLVVLRTLPGNASPLAVAIDREEFDDVVGTVAGDDTILVITPEGRTAEKFRKRMLDLASH